MRTHEVVMEWVTRELTSGRLQLGDRLPGERTLAETLGVSRSSLREALRVLEALGTLRSGTGSGPTSGTIVVAEPEQALSLSLHLQLATSQVSHEHVAETRVLLETWAARRAALYDQDWDDAARILTLMEQPSLSVEQFLALDAQFHVTLSHAAQNPLISTLMESLRLSIAEHTAKRAIQLPDWPATSARLRSEHREILGSLRNEEFEQAARLLEAHIQRYHAETGDG